MLGRRWQSARRRPDRLFDATFWNPATIQTLYGVQYTCVLFVPLIYGVPADDVQVVFALGWQTNHIVVEQVLMALTNVIALFWFTNVIARSILRVIIDDHHVLPCHIEP